VGLISERIRLIQNSDVQICVLPWEVESVVTLKGSFRTHPDIAGGQGITQDLAIGLLDKGTKAKTKLEIAEYLESAGASITFSSDGPRVRFSVKCLRKDVNGVVQLLVEQLTKPRFDTSELDLLKRRVLAGIERQKQNTSNVARSALSRHLYSAGHPGHQLPFEDLQEAVKVASLSDIAAYYSERCPFDDVRISVVGDLDHQEPENWFDELTLDRSDKNSPDDGYDLRALGRAREHVEIADRNNLDVVFAHPLDVRTTDPDYLALWTGVFVLGGNFSSRLMSTIRDRDGLTYGIRSSLSGMNSLHGGAWSTSVTLSQENLERGIDATLAEITAFVESGVTASELEERKQTLKGSYQVQLATTAGLASRVLTNLERGHAMEMIDDHPQRIEDLTLSDVNRMIGKCLTPEKLVIASAGSTAD